MAERFLNAVDYLDNESDFSDSDDPDSDETLLRDRLETVRRDTEERLRRAREDLEEIRRTLEGNQENLHRDREENLRRIREENLHRDREEDLRRLETLRRLREDMVRVMREELEHGEALNVWDNNVDYESIGSQDEVMENYDQFRFLDFTDALDEQDLIYPNCLHDAVKEGSLLRIRAILTLRPDLVDEKEDPSHWTNTSEWEGTPLHIACAGLQFGSSTPHSIEILKTLLDEYGADLNSTNKWGRPPLWVAFATENDDLGKFILETYNPDMNMRDVYGNSSLHRVGFWGNQRGCQILISYGADTEATNNNNESVLDVCGWDDWDEQTKKAMSERKKKVNMFQDVISNVSTGPWMRSKLMVVGGGRTGKSSLVRSLLNQSYEKDLDSTIGVSLTRTQMRTKGNYFEETDESITDYTMQTAMKVMATRKKSLKNRVLPVPRLSEHKVIKTLKRRSMARSKGEGTTSVKRKGPVFNDTEIIRKFDEKLLIQEETGDKSMSFTIWDYGGQQVFYTLHHLFLTQYGIYMLVFDMRKVAGRALQDSGHLEPSDLESTLNTIVFWTNSIKMHAPEAPFIMIGTFGDEIKSNDDFEKINKTLLSLAAFKGRTNVIKNTDRDLIFFPIDNTTGLGNEPIIKAIKKTAHNQNYVNMEISFRWLRCLDLILDEKAPWLSLSKVKEIANENGINTRVEVEEMLSLFHELGVLLWFNASDALRAVVTKDPQWLISCLSKVIRDDKLHAFNVDEIDEVGLTTDVNHLFGQALVSRDLLEYLWEKDEIIFLLDLMKRTLLLSDWGFSTDNEEHYLIPSLLDNISEHDNRKTYQDVRFVVCFEMLSGFLPVGVFERVVCLAVTHSSNSSPLQPPALNKSGCVLWFGDVSCVLNRHEESIRFGTDDILQASSVLSMLESMMIKVNQDFMNGGLKWKVKLWNKDLSDSFVDIKEAKHQKLTPWFSAIGEQANQPSVNINSLMDL